MPTTSNYGWDIPADTDLVKNGALAIRTLGNSADTTVKSVADGRGLVHLNSTSFSAVASQSINDVFSSTYDHYRIIIEGVQTVETDLNIRYRVSGADNSTSNYGTARLNLRTGASGNFGGRTATTGFIGNLNTTRRGNVSIDLFNPFASLNTSYNSLASGDNETYTYLDVVAGTFGATTSFTGFTIYPSSGNMTGSVSTFGYRKS